MGWGVLYGRAFHVASMSFVVGWLVGQFCFLLCEEN